MWPNLAYRTFKVNVAFRRSWEDSNLILVRSSLFQVRWPASTIKHSWGPWNVMLMVDLARVCGFSHYFSVPTLRGL